MKQVADKKRRDVEFSEGHMVYLKLQPYRQHSAFNRAHQKLASKFYGPYPIIQRIDKVAYKLKLPEGARIHPVLHVSLLKKSLGDHSNADSDLPPITEEGAIILKPARILDTRWVKQGATFVEESLVQWRRLPKEDATWEKTEDLKQQFPSMDLEDNSPQGVDEPRRSRRQAQKNPKYFGSAQG